MNKLCSLGLALSVVLCSVLPLAADEITVVVKMSSTDPDGIGWDAFTNQSPPDPKIKVDDGNWTPFKLDTFEATFTVTVNDANEIFIIEVADDDHPDPANDGTVGRSIHETAGTVKIRKGETKTTNNGAATVTIK